MKKARDSGEDCYMSLLNQRNTPRDDVLGSSAQRLMSRRTKTKLPTTEEQLQPQPIKTTVVRERLQQYRDQQAKYYNRTAKRLQPLERGDVVRVESKNGFKKKGTILRKAEYPRSYIVESGNREYRRNRRQIIKVEEQPEYSEIEESESKQVTQDVRNGRETAQEELFSNTSMEKKTRSGRVVKAPDRLNL